MYADTNSGNNQASSQVLHPGSRKLFHHWEALRAESACPSRAQLNFASIRDTLPNLLILEWRSHAATYTFRLSGTGITEILGEDQTGKDMLAGWDSFERRLVSDVLATATRQKQPALLRMRLTRQSGTLSGVEMIALPFIAQTGNVHLVGGLFAFAKPPQFTDPVVRRELLTVRTLWTEHGTGDTLLRTAERQGVPLLRVIKGGLG